MSSFKEKSQGFIIGIMVGLIVAGGFFILKLDNYFKELNFYKNVVKPFSSESKTNESEEKLADKQLSKEKRSTDTKTKNKKNTTGSLNKNDSIVDTSIHTNTKIKDSTYTLGGAAASDDIVVRKDELLFTKTLEVINLGPVTKANPKDSLLQKVSGIKEDKNNSKQFFNIEFWSSPLNYKGYKLGKYKMVLYGITSAEGIKVFKLDDTLYLKNSGIVYKLDYADDFKPYERVSEDTIINKLK
jgi:hypothetical protein